MLDMTFQLMSFFILTFHPKPLEGQMEFNLPAEKDSTANPNKEMEQEPDLEIPTNYTVIVKAAGGAIKDMIIKDDKGEVPVGPELATLKTKLTTMHAGVKKDDKSGNAIKIQAESALKYAFLVQVMDTCRAAGFTNVGFAAPPDFQR